MSARRHRVLLVGLGSTTQSALEALTERFEVTSLVRPGDDEVVKAAQALGIGVCDRTTIAALTERVEQDQPDAVVVSSYDRILPADLVGSRPFVNVHYAPLPRYRGRATVNWAILNGEPSTAITVHCLEPGLDAGGILAQQSVEIGPRSTAGGLYEELNALQRRLLGDAVERRLRGDLGTPQDEAAATYSCARVPDDGEIRWSDSTAAVDRLVRALDGPFPPAFTFLRSRRVDVLRAHPAEDAHAYDGRVPGRVVRVDRAGGTVDVLTGDGVLRLVTLSVEPDRPVPAATVVTSVRQTLVSRTDARLAALEERLRAMTDQEADASRGRQQEETR
jgi:methionyl-tRNA formyltransferase